MISAKELREGNCNKEAVERGLILVDKLVKDNRMRRYVDVKLSKVFYNEYEFDAILKELNSLGYFIDLSFKQSCMNNEESSLNRGFILRW